MASDLGNGLNEFVGAQRRRSQAVAHSGDSINSFTLVQMALSFRFAS
jgi:hypothetical protein